MKKILFFSLLLLFAITGCNDKEVLDDVNEKTLLVYFPWTGSDSISGLTPYLEESISKMQSAITSSTTLDMRRVFVLMANSTTETNLYELVYTGGTTGEKKFVKSYGDAQRYSTKEGIQEVLQDVTTLAPAMNYAFITGGHGCGWIPASSWKEYPKNARSLTSFGSTSDLKKYGIDVEDLADAIEDAGIKMQFIMFDNCYMQNIETAYALKDATNFMIGTTTEVNVAGMPYDNMFAQLIATAPNYSTITQAFYSYYSSYYGTISVVDCRQMDALADEMKQINGKYTFPEVYRDSVQAFDGYTPQLFYDFRDYSRWLTDSDSVSMTKVDSLLKIAIRSEQHTSKYHTEIEPKHDGIIKVHSGLTISDPSEHPVALRTKEETLWWQATH